MVVNAIKFHSVSETHGYAVERIENKYQISFVQKVKSTDSKTTYLREGLSRNFGQLLCYASPFIADFVIRKEILPLYKKAILQ